MLKITKNYPPIDAKWKAFVKRPIRISAVQIDEPFIVETLEGDMQGKAGDFLIEGVEGELYPCDKDIFRKTYKEGF